MSVDDQQRSLRLREELERLDGEVQALEDRIDELLGSSSSSSSSDSDSSDSDSDDDDADSLDAVEEAEADLRRAHAHRSLLEQKLRALEWKAKHAAKQKAAARRQAAIDARSADLLNRVRASQEAQATDGGMDDDDYGGGRRSAARSLRRQM
jgi:hypothetical protein